MEKRRSKKRGKKKEYAYICDEIRKGDSLYRGRKPKLGGRR